MAAKIHVMHVLGSFAPGGAEMGVARLIERLSGDGFEHSVCSLSPDLSLRGELPAEIPCHSLEIHGPSRTAFLPLARLARQRGADLLHVNNLAPWGDTLLASRLAGCRCIETFHGVEQGQGRFPWGRRQAFSLLASGSAAVTAVSAASARMLEDMTGIAQGRVKVISNGIDCRRFSPSPSPEARQKLRRELELPLDAVLFGCVAGLRPVKNHRGLIRAFADTGQTESTCYLCLVGTGPEEDALRALAAAEGISDRVRFLGQRRDVEDLLRAFDAFVLNSETEGLSYAVLEAMAAGLPVIASAVGANPELICPEQEGWLFPAGDQEALTRFLTEAVQSPCRLKDAGRMARQKVEAGFSLDAMAHSYAELYRGVVARSRKGKGPLPLRSHQ